MHNDSENRLIGAVFNYQGREGYSYSFIYNAVGQIIKKATIPVAGFNFANDESYAYDNLGRVIGDTT